MKLKKGDVFFIMNKTRKISRLMAWFMGSKWSHSGIIKEVTDESIYTIETSDLQVWIGDFQEYLDGDFDVEVWRQDNEEISKEAVETAKKYLGKMYGYLQLLGFAVSCLLKRIGIEYSNPIRQGLVCCAVVFYAYYKKLPGFDKDPESRHTQELYEIISKNKDKWSLIFNK